MHCLIKHHAMKLYRGSGQLHALATLPLGKKPQYPLGSRLGNYSKYLLLLLLMCLSTQS